VAVRMKAGTVGIAMLALTATLVAGCQNPYGEPVTLPPGAISAAPGEPVSPRELADALATSVAENGGAGLMMTGRELAATELPGVPRGPWTVGHRPEGYWIGADGVAIWTAKSGYGHWMYFRQWPYSVQVPPGDDPRVRFQSVGERGDTSFYLTVYRRSADGLACLLERPWRQIVTRRYSLRACGIIAEPWW